MSAPLTELELRNQIAYALSTAGANCGDCSFEPGDRGKCRYCEQHWTWCADELLPLFAAAQARVAELEAQAAAAESRGRAIGHVAGLREAAEMIDVADDCGCGGCDSCTSRLDAARIRAHADLLADALTGITAVAS